MGCGRLGARFREHALRDVDTNDTAVGSDLPGRMQCRESGPGAGVEHAIARLQPAEIDQSPGRRAVPVAVAITARTNVEARRDLFPVSVHGSVRRYPGFR